MSSDSLDEGAPRKRTETMGGLAKGLAIIELFSTAQPRLTVAQAATSADMTRAAARRCLLTLEALGYVAHDGKFFTPSARLRRLGSMASLPGALLERAQPVLDDLRDRLNEPISLAVLDHNECLFIARAEATRMVSTGVRLGGRLPAYCSATGRVLLAGRTRSQIEDFLSKTDLVERTPRTETNVEKLLLLISSAAADNFAISDEELELGMRSMAVPVKDQAGDTIAALSLSTSAARVSAETMHAQYLSHLQRAATSLSE